MGALADCFKRFPLIGEFFKTVFPGLLKKLIEDTRRHEANCMDLVQKLVDRLSPHQYALKADKITKADKYEDRPQRLPDKDPTASRDRQLVRCTNCSSFL